MKYPITPVTKPRQTRRDKWLTPARPPVARYRAFASECRLRGVQLPESGAKIVFHLPMPESWNEKKRDKMRGQPHQQTPDKDNLEKALMDAVLKQDCRVWQSLVEKRWADVGAIEINEGVIK